MGLIEVLYDLMCSYCNHMQICSKDYLEHMNGQVIKCRSCGKKRRLHEYYVRMRFNNKVGDHVKQDRSGRIK